MWCALGARHARDGRFRDGYAMLPQALLRAVRVAGANEWPSVWTSAWAAHGMWMAEWLAAGHATDVSHEVIRPVEVAEAFADLLDTGAQVEAAAARGGVHRRSPTPVTGRTRDRQAWVQLYDETLTVPQ